MGTVGVVGAGVMGAGVAQELAEAGHAVVLVDRTTAHLDRARDRIVRDLRTGQLLGRRTGTRPIEEVVGAVRLSTDLADLAGAEAVVENVTERWDVKAALYPRLDAATRPGCVLAANTSAIPITRIASATSRPGDVVGVHFMNPVPAVHTVELIAGHHTTPATLARTRALLDSMGKRAVEVGDGAGFVSNRVLMLAVNEAAELVREGAASAADVDRVFTDCAGHRMGPLATADLIGLDTVLLSIEVLHDHYRDGRYRPSPLLRRLVDAGLLGRKSGRGFFPYD